MTIRTQGNFMSCEKDFIVRVKVKKDDEDYKSSCSSD